MAIFVTKGNLCYMVMFWLQHCNSVPPESVLYTKGNVLLYVQRAIFFCYTTKGNFLLYVQRAILWCIGTKGYIGTKGNFVLHKPRSRQDFNSLPVAYFSIYIRIHLSRWVESRFIQILCNLKSSCERSYRYKGQFCRHKIALCTYVTKHPLIVLIA